MLTAWQLIIIISITIAIHVFKVLDVEEILFVGIIVAVKLGLTKWFSLIFIKVPLLNHGDFSDDSIQ